tara:strand:+ start:91 stop:459 length:369 start_codon:yes stop_codon:yes gene_type:complete
MNELKSVYAKINSVSKEVELSSEKVKFNISKEVVSSMKEAQKEWSKGDSKEAKIKDLANDAISDYKQARLKYNEAFKSYEKLASSAKELGLEVPKQVQDLGERAKSFLDEGGEKIKSLQKIR